ncbi:5099_t:CDS:1, partial [Dentiscutata heterogama]
NANDDGTDINNSIITIVNDSARTSEIDHSEHPLITKISSQITLVETDTEITE